MTFQTVSYQFSPFCLCCHNLYCHFLYCFFCLFIVVLIHFLFPLGKHLLLLAKHPPEYNDDEIGCTDGDPLFCVAHLVVTGDEVDGHHRCVDEQCQRQDDGFTISFHNFTFLFQRINHTRPITVHIPPIAYPHDWGKAKPSGAIQM